jgi:hypothetical protein
MLSALCVGERATAILRMPLFRVIAKASATPLITRAADGRFISPLSLRTALDRLWVFTEYVRTRWC